MTDVCSILILDKKSLLPRVPMTFLVIYSLNLQQYKIQIGLIKLLFNLRMKDLCIGVRSALVPSCILTQIGP